MLPNTSANIEDTTDIIITRIDLKPKIKTLPMSAGAIAMITSRIIEEVVILSFI
jgi:hypothetical protein